MEDNKISELFKKEKYSEVIGLIKQEYNTTWKSNRCCIFSRPKNTTRCNKIRRNIIFRCIK